MRVKPIDLVIDESDPFRNDLLDRNDYVHNILSLYRSVDESLIISLSGRYGSGKTTILKMLSAEAKKSGFVAILFNAWQYDYSVTTIKPLKWIL